MTVETNMSKKQWTERHLANLQTLVRAYGIHALIAQIERLKRPGKTGPRFVAREWLDARGNPRAWSPRTDIWDWKEAARWVESVQEVYIARGGKLHRGAQRRALRDLYAYYCQGNKTRSTARAFDLFARRIRGWLERMRKSEREIAAIRRTAGTRVTRQGLLVHSQEPEAAADFRR